MSKSRMENFLPRFDITGKLGYKEYKKDLQQREVGRFPGAQKYEQKIPFKKVKEFRIPQTKRTSNDPVTITDEVGPQSYDILSGHGYVDIKNLELMSKLSRRGEQSLMG